jgi:CRP/FNR family cyclic AMP-dependent transcriptional regulator
MGIGINLTLYLMKQNELLGFENRMLVRVLKKNAILRYPEMLNKYVYLLKEGFVKIAVTNEEGREVIKYLVKPGDLFGEIPLLGISESYEDYAVALEDSVVYFADVEQMQQWINVDPDLRTKIYKQMGERIRKAENRFLSMVFKDAQARIRSFLTELLSEFGKLTEEGYKIKNFLTHDDIAKLTDTSRQTVSSILNELRDQKLIEYNTEIILIPFSSKLWRDNPDISAPR